MRRDQDIPIMVPIQINFSSSRDFYVCGRIVHLVMDFAQDFISPPYSNSQLQLCSTLVSAVKHGTLDNRGGSRYTKGGDCGTGHGVAQSGKECC